MHASASRLLCTVMRTMSAPASAHRLTCKQGGSDRRVCVWCACASGRRTNGAAFACCQPPRSSVDAALALPRSVPAPAAAAWLPACRAAPCHPSSQHAPIPPSSRRPSPSAQHLLHSGLNVAGVGGGHGLQGDGVLAAHLDGANLQVGRRGRAGVRRLQVAAREAAGPLRPLLHGLGHKLRWKEQPACSRIASHVGMGSS